MYTQFYSFICLYYRNFYFTIILLYCHQIILYMFCNFSTLHLQDSLVSIAQLFLPVSNTLQTWKRVDFLIFHKPGSKISSQKWYPVLLASSLYITLLCQQFVNLYLRKLTLISHQSFNSVVKQRNSLVVRFH